MMPSPQREREQSGRHCASGDVEFFVPRSHSSPASSAPFPQSEDAKRQSEQTYGSPASWRDCSHCSPRSFWMIPSPQIPTSRRQVAVHPSLSRIFPSSHSSGLSRTPLPQSVAAATMVGFWQELLIQRPTRHSASVAHGLQLPLIQMPMRQSALLLQPFVQMLSKQI